MTEPVSTWELLKDLGFRPDPGTLSENGSGLVFDFGNLQLSAGRFLNTRLLKIILLSGVLATSRAIAEISRVNAATSGLPRTGDCAVGMVPGSGLKSRRIHAPQICPMDSRRASESRLFALEKGRGNLCSPASLSGLARMDANRNQDARQPPCIG
jgi:hypothetical protein